MSVARVFVLFILFLAWDLLFEPGLVLLFGSIKCLRCPDKVLLHLVVGICVLIPRVKVLEPTRLLAAGDSIEPLDELGLRPLDDQRLFSRPPSQLS